MQNNNQSDGSQPMGDQTDNANDEAKQKEKAFVEHWQGLIKARKKDLTDYHAEITKDRLYVQGFNDKNKKKRTMVNLVFSTLASALPNIYAKNPEIAVTPADMVESSDYSDIKPLTRTGEIIVNKQLGEADLKRRAKAVVRAALTSKIGWIKASYQHDIETDPLIERRINDTQDDLQRINALICECEDEQGRGDLEAEQEKLRLLTESLEAKVEVSHAEGTVLDQVQSEDMLWSSEVSVFDDYVNAEWLAQRVWMSFDKYTATFGREPSDKSKVFNSKQKEGEASINRKDSNARYAVWEIWDKTTSTVLTLTEGEEEWAREPYQPETSGERFYPYFALAFHLIDGQFLPLSTVELIRELQDEYNDTRDQYRDHRKQNVPHYHVAADIDEKTIKKETVSQVGEYTIIDTNGRPLSESFRESPKLTIDPAQYDTSQTRNDLELMSGLGDAARGSIRTAKTATEADILQSGLASRSGEMQDAIEDWIRDIAIYIFELCLQEIDINKAQRLAGKGAHWPEMDKEEIFDLVQIEVRAGTSGKPNKIQEQKQWLELLPQLKELIESVAMLRTEGKDDMADVLVNVARETLRRFDERMDVEEYLPQATEEDNVTSPEDEMAMQEKADLMRKELEKLDAAINKTKAETEKLNAETIEIVAPLNQNVPQSIPQY